MVGFRKKKNLFIAMRMRDYDHVLEEDDSVVL